MNEQDKALQGMIEFCQWLIPNAKQLGLEQSKSIAMISQAQTPDDIVNGMNSLYQELGEEQFAALTQVFQKSKSQYIPMNKKGAKINYLVNKFADGGDNEDPEIETHVKGKYTPLWASFMAADRTYLPKRDGTFNQRHIKRVWDPVNGIMTDRIYKDTGEYTERRVTFDSKSPKADTVFHFNGENYYPGEEMYQRYQDAWGAYGVKHFKVPFNTKK